MTPTPENDIAFTEPTTGPVIADEQTRNRMALVIIENAVVLTGAVTEFVVRDKPVTSLIMLGLGELAIGYQGYRWNKRAKLDALKQANRDALLQEYLDNTGPFPAE